MALASFVGPWVPELILLGAALLIFLFDVVGVRRLEAVGAVAVGGTALALLFVVADLGFAPIAGLATVPAGQVDPAPALRTASLYTFTSLGLVFQAIFLLAALLVSVASLSRPSREKGAPIFFGLLSLATLGMLLVAVASDLIFLLLSIEVTSISTYLLVAYSRRDARSLEAAMKFYIIGALSTTLSFFGASLLFGAYGTTNLYLIHSQAAAGTTIAGGPVLVLLGYAFLIAGLAFKATLVPFHAWAVDVYDGAPTDVTAFLAGASKKVGIFAFFLVLIGPVLVVTSTGWSPFAGGSAALGPVVQIVLAVVAVLTMTVGNVLALLQKEMKRMLAYSSISQAGYMLIGITVGTAPAIAGATLQVFAHVFMKGGAFLVVAGVAGLGVGPLIDDWRGLGARRPLLGTAFGLMLLSLAGVPFTIGFWSKFILFSSAVQAQGYFVWLAVAGLLNSALSVFYYARVLKVMFFDTPPAPAPLPAGAVVGGSEPPVLGAGGFGWGRAVAVGIAAVAIVALGVYPQPIFGAVQTAAQHFVATGA
ncbi:MAG TPA: NADH-quinone oxidoreductase subunit N [Thermoplasmata archaeon]|nr:NADH-quinone oxidoreductase subunit N [Thermoplasmata archaeon]